MNAAQLLNPSIAFLWSRNAESPRSNKIQFSVYFIFNIVSKRAAMQVRKTTSVESLPNWQ